MDVGTSHSPSLVVLRITRRNSALDTPKESRTDTACNRPKVHEPCGTGPVVDVQASGIERVSNTSESQCPPESDQVGQPGAQEARDSHERIQQSISRID